MSAGLSVKDGGVSREQFGQEDSPSAPASELPSGRRVLFIAPQPFFANRGTPFNVKAIVETIAQAGTEVDLLVYPIGEPVDMPQTVTIRRCLGVPGISEVPIGPSWRKLILDVPLSLSAFWYALTRRYDVIHGVEEGGVLAGCLGLLTRTKYVFDMDSSMPEQLKSSGFFTSTMLLNLVASIESFFIRKAAAVLTVCRDLSDKVRAISPVSEIHQIEDCPVEGAGVTAEADVLAWRVRYGLGDKKVILYTGNFEPYQGIDLLFDSFAALAKNPNVVEQPKLVLVGGGEGACSRREFYRNRASALGILDAIVFTGQRPPAEMGVAMAAADVLVSPRITGGNTPLKIYSYMAAQRPIVATDIYSHTQVLSKENAYLASAQPDAFAKALFAACFGAEQQRDSIVLNAKTRLDEHYSREAFERKVLSLYANLFA